MKVSRRQIFQRGLTLRCPNCGQWGLFRNWFKLNEMCRACSMTLEKEEGFYLGTSSIGYVMAICFVLIPVLVMVVNDLLSVWTGIAVGIFGSIFFTVALYPIFLSWVITFYYACFPGELPANKETKE